MTQPNIIPPHIQAELHEQGVLPDADYKLCKDGRVTLNAAKLRAYIEEHGEPWH